MNEYETPFDNLDVGDLELSEDTVAANVLDEMLGVEGLDFGEDLTSLDLEEDFGDGLDLSFGDEDEDLDAATLLRTQVDISKEFVKYYQAVHNARQKIMAVSAADGDKYSMPSFTEFSFIANQETRRIVYGFFCEMLKDLATEERYASLTSASAFELLLQEMYDEIHYTPSIFVTKLHAIFDTYYEKNCKLVKAKTKTWTGTIADIVDAGQVALAEFVYGINSMPFAIVTRYFEDPSLVVGNVTIKPQDFGELAVEIKRQRAAGNPTHRDLFNYILTFLSSDETLNSLEITRDESLEFTTGELLRRVILQELNDGSFYPVGMANLTVEEYSDQLLGKLYRSVVDSMQKQSMAAEILCFILEMMHASSNSKSGVFAEYMSPFTVGLARFLSAAARDKSLVNPVFYTFIGNPSEEGEDGEFELGYVEGEKTLVIKSSNVLCEVVGDNSSIYHIPLVYVGDDTHSVICPPPEVLDGIRKLTPSGRLSVNGNIVYSYTPSASWLSSLSISSDFETEEEQVTSLSIGQSNNPLLDFLLRYSNKFDMSGSQPRFFEAVVDNSTTFLMMQQDEGQGMKVLSMVAEGARQELDHGTALLDEDNSLIVRYLVRGNSEEQVQILDSAGYTLTQFDADGSTDSDEHITLSNIFRGQLDNCLVEGDPYSKVVAQKVCGLNSLSYASLLEEARVIIVRDLLHIIGASRIDQMLGTLMVDKYISVARDQCQGKLDSFNLHTLKELWGFTYGEPNILDGVLETSPELLDTLQQQNRELAASVLRLSDFVTYLGSLDLHMLALQACSRSELSTVGDKSMYAVLHTIPAIHAKLRVLEDQLVLLLALQEIGDDITSLFMKSSATLSAYTAVCVKDRVLKVEASLKSGMRIKNIKSGLEATKAILFNELPESYAILKYFVLERNTYGILSELEECIAQGDKTFQGLHADFLKELGFAENTQVGQMSELDFKSQLNQQVVNSAYAKFHEEFAKLCIAGLISEVSLSTDIQVLKAYDILTVYGRYLFNLPVSVEEDYYDVSEFEDQCFSYIGSFLVTYSPIIGEAADEIDGGIDRCSSYLMHRKDYLSFVPLSFFEKYDLRDLKLVLTVEPGDIEVQDEDIPAGNGSTTA